VIPKSPYTPSFFSAAAAAAAAAALKDPKNRILASQPPLAAYARILLRFGAAAGQKMVEWLEKPFANILRAESGER
jgi:hypothetical protein